MKAHAAVVASLAAKARAGGLSGRGGAGNWSFGGGGGDGGEEEEEKRRREEEELEKRVLRDVEVGLAPPARVYVPPR